jgi:glycerol-3-phosphate cytidylyltransferase-like family protein
LSRHFFEKKLVAREISIITVPAMNNNTHNSTPPTITDQERKEALEELSLLSEQMTDDEIDELARLDAARQYHRHACHEI